MNVVKWMLTTSKLFNIVSDSLSPNVKFSACHTFQKFEIGSFNVRASGAFSF